MVTKNPNLIVKNSTFLFIRLSFILVIAFYTTRLTLGLLGDEDYGINNIVGGIVTLFSIISFPIVNSLQRFFNVEFTKKNIPEKDIFKTSIRIIFLMIIIIGICYETIGLFLINYIIKYPPERMFAVQIIFQFSILSTIANFLTIPYTALLFSKENMGIPATLDVVDYIYKLCFLLLLPLIEVDYLVAYSFLFLTGRLLILGLYHIYCKYKYSHIILKGNVNISLKRNMLNFSGWNMIESAAGIIITYVSNILMNVFGGVLYNAAYGISRQIESAIFSFVSNLMKAIDPQITSNTVAGENLYRDNLIQSSVKISLLFLGACLIIFHFKGSFLVSLWLGHLPQYVILFTELTIISIIFACITMPFRTVLMAVGNIKGFFVVKGVISLVCVTFMYILLSLGFRVETAMFVFVIYNFVYFVFTIFYTSRNTDCLMFPLVKNLVFCILILLIGYILIYFLDGFFSNSFLSLAIDTTSLVILIVLFGYFLVLSKKEKIYINYLLNKIL